MNPERRGPIARAMIAVLSFYRTAISPALPPTCRYSPSCSAYAIEAVQLHGAGRGSWLALRRLLRCHPFHAGGHDPVPLPVAGDEGAGGPAGTADAALPITWPSAV
ncbi:MAG: uncharacterized protein QOH89_2801 [Pseudonocardiales bacterium]|nr:uncharacterized protein [Pseudonocardiales bacterium]